MALMCRSRATPARAHASTTVRAPSTCTARRPGREGPAPALVQEADEIDDRRGVAQPRIEQAAVERIALDDLDGRQQDQMARIVAPPGDRGDAMARGGKARNQVAADET